MVPTEGGGGPSVVGGAVVAGGAVVVVLVVVVLVVVVLVLVLVLLVDDSAGAPEFVGAADPPHALRASAHASAVRIAHDLSMALLSALPMRPITDRFIGMTSHSPSGHNVAASVFGGEDAVELASREGALFGGFTDFIAVVDLAEGSLQRIAVTGHTIVYPWGPNQLFVIENVLGRKSQLRVTLRSRDALFAVNSEIPVVAEVTSDDLGDEEQWQVGLLPPFVLALEDTAATLVETVHADSRRGRFVSGVFSGEPPWLDVSGTLHGGDGPSFDCRDAAGWGHRVWALGSDGTLADRLGRGPWRTQLLPETAGEYQSLFHQPIEGVLLAVSWTRFPSRGGPRSDVAVVDAATGEVRQAAVGGLLTRASLVGESVVGIDVTDQVHVSQLSSPR